MGRSTDGVERFEPIFELLQAGLEAIENDDFLLRGGEIPLFCLMNI